MKYPWMIQLNLINQRIVFSGLWGRVDHQVHTNYDGQNFKKITCTHNKHIFPMFDSVIPDKCFACSPIAR